MLAVPGKILHPDQKLIVDGEQTCLDCYNKLLEEAGENTLTQGQFQCKWHNQHIQHAKSLPPNLAVVTKRTANFKGKSAELEASCPLLNRREEHLAKAATDYMATFAKGMAGMYVCRNEELLLDDFFHCEKNVAGRVSVMNKAGVYTVFFLLSS